MAAQICDSSLRLTAMRGYISPRKQTVEVVATSMHWWDDRAAAKPRAPKGGLRWVWMAALSLSWSESLLWSRPQSFFLFFAYGAMPAMAAWIDRLPAG